MFYRNIKPALFRVDISAVVTDRLTLPRQMELAKIFTVDVPLVDKSLLV